jgi:hypothetical protein
MKGDFADAFGVLFLERLGNTMVQLPNSFRGIDSTSTSAISSCAKANRLVVARQWGGASRRARLRDRESHRRLATRAGADEQTNVELAPSDGGCAQHRLRAR